MSGDKVAHRPPSGRGENTLVARRLGIDTQHEAVVFMHKDCAVCRSEGFTAHARVRLEVGRRSIIATLYQVTGDLLVHGEAGLSESAWRLLGLRDGENIKVSHPRPLVSLSDLRSKIYGSRLGSAAMRDVINDIVGGRYSDIHISSFLTACAARPLLREELIDLTTAMIEAGNRLTWNEEPIVDKHCVGGLPGNRTTPILVGIIAACGMTIPKTSSRAITSPAGTADTMETLAPVNLDLKSMRRVVEREGGCVVWGGAVRLSPADDTLIRVERALDLDSEGQLIASVLSKKVAAGSSHLVLDLPIGPTAKVRGEAAGDSLSEDLQAVARVFGIETRVVLTDGRQPVGRGIGPALEARDVLAVLQNSPDAPQDLRQRALMLSAALIELVGKAEDGHGMAVAERALASGDAWRKFQAICDAQGGMRVPPDASFSRPVEVGKSGRVTRIDNRRLARVAKLAGAPDSKASGLELHVHLGTEVEAGQPMFTVCADTRGELHYALDYVSANDGIIEVAE